MCRIYFFSVIIERRSTKCNENAISVNERIAISNILNVHLFLIRLSVPTHSKKSLRFVGTLVTKNIAHSGHNYTSTWLKIVFFMLRLKINRERDFRQDFFSRRNQYFSFHTQGVRKSKISLLFIKKVYISISGRRFWMLLTR